MKDKMNITSAEYPYGVSEWEQAGFTPVPSLYVRPPRVAESPLSMECRLFQIVPHGTGPMSANYVIGEVVCFHVAKRIMDGEAIDPRKIDYIGRMSDNWYNRANETAMFEQERPPKIQKTPIVG